MAARLPRIRAGTLVLVASLLLTAAVRAEPARLSQGFTLAARMRSAPYRSPDGPNVIVHAPPGFDANAKLHLVVFLHGYSGCLPVLMGQGPTPCLPGDAKLHPGRDLGAHHDAAGTNTLFVVPQLAFMKRSARSGSFERPLGFRAFLEELLGETLAEPLGAARTLADLASITLLAHSAGYESARVILERGGVSELVRAVVLFDALYGRTDAFARFIEAHAASGLRFVSIHLGRGAPARESSLLGKRLSRRLGRARVKTRAEASEIPDALRSHAVVIARGVLPHAQVPEHHMSEVLRALDLPRRP